MVVEGNIARYFAEAKKLTESDRMPANLAKTIKNMISEIKKH